MASSSSSAMNSSSHHRPGIQSAKFKHHSSAWLVHELLKRTDTTNGDVSLFHYPMTQVPYITMEEMQQAFDELASFDGNQEMPPEYVERAQAEARSRIHRIQFCWYQFPQFPTLTDAYVNIQHVDIRQNASLTSIDSIITQLPNLTSFNLSDCPNVRTLAPLASVALSENDATNGEYDSSRRHNSLALKHLWVRGCSLSNMTNEEWANVFEALAGSSGPLERLTLSRNNISYLHGNIGKVTSLTYLFLEDNSACGSNGFVIPGEIGSLHNLRFASLCGNNIMKLPRQVAHLNPNCDVYLHRNPNLRYPPPQYQMSIKMMRHFFHQERMKIFRGSVLLIPHLTRARWRALERLYQPGGSGYFGCKERFEETVRRTSITYS
ncbi:hypothetical protein QTG54_014169 [Skeletonema marinoi]|uniref:Uncharacterized protein n=1 Tax=Skeletonema marinoi TaxID=267567 RepID=A0AAD9D6Z7_9STRA|nr:hypothetical protein QTG54_014169 [Skeletonema marinoi]